MQKEIDESIFKRNDIRGIYPSELDEGTMYKLGKVLAAFLKSKNILVGFDTRNSSKPLFNALSKGIREQGVNVYLLGVVDTPGIYFVSRSLKMPSIMITASHNPPKYNGLKITDREGKSLGQLGEINMIKEIVLRENFKEKRIQGKERKLDISQRYKKFLKSFVEEEIDKMNIVVDAGNGVSGEFMSYLCRDFPIKIKKLYFERNGSFPHHIPNPLIPKNTKDLSKEIIKTKADFGVAFDADADRIFFVDEKGKRVSSSIIAALIIENLKGKAVIYNTPISRIVQEIAESRGMKAYRERVGRDSIVNRMKKEDADFGVEHSGHYYYKKNDYCDSAFITFLLVCEIYSKSKKDGKKFSEMIRPLQKYLMPEEINLICSNPDESLEFVKNHFSNNKDAKIDLHDGLRLEFKDWWFSLRKSNNEKIVRLNVEANNEREMRNKVKIIQGLIK